MAGILEGKVALITGAGSGIGQATSRIFAREGAKLVLADVVEEGGNQTLKMVQELRATRSSSSAMSRNGATLRRRSPRRSRPTGG
jgi:NAD(P)-dependent dehydrogenase (short-subunit alcohol dehydrogenase family)